MIFRREDLAEVSQGVRPRVPVWVLLVGAAGVAIGIVSQKIVPMAQALAEGARDIDPKVVFDGFYGDLLGMFVSVAVIYVSVRGLKAEMSQQSRENDRLAERAVLVEVISEIGKLPQAIKGNDITRGDGESEQVFSGLHVSLAKLKLQITEEDHKLFQVLGRWERRIREEGIGYWSARNNEEMADGAKYLAQDPAIWGPSGKPPGQLRSIAMRGIQSQTDYLVVQIVEYGRSGAMKRTSIVADMAKKISDHYHDRKDEWAEERAIGTDWDFTVPDPFVKSK